MKNYLLFFLVFLIGCTTNINRRPTQGLLNSCSLYALANAIEIQKKKSINREERLRVWRLTNKTIGGATLDDAFKAAREAKWVALVSWLQVVDDLDSELHQYPLNQCPVICCINGHAIMLISIRIGLELEDDEVIYFDPRYNDAQSINLNSLNIATGGIYWKVMEK